ncbi:MAG: hypothetical protein NTX48_15970 [Planctomycetales bacterium]|nr:hypothetical protein [Planctomycetales bacterium]
MGRKSDPPVVLIKWYDFTKWLLDNESATFQTTIQLVAASWRR